MHIGNGTSVKAAALADDELRMFWERHAAEITPYTKGTYLLTDDKAPVEVLGMRVIDGLIQEELGYYKAIYEEEGLSGLIASF